MKGKHLEGILAVNKPPSISSAQVLRDLQKHFTPSKFFAPWVQAERTRRALESPFQRRRRRDKRPVEVKIGHGGTLDPLATGVLVTGIGKGTKHLPDFLSCTKTYEAVVLFGVATDSYDRLGKVVGRAPYEHITREKVEDALKQFRGSYMQLPPIFSSVRIKGKHLYEYARNGEEIPGEVEKRPVTVTEMAMLEWYEGGQHEHKWPSEEAETSEKVVAEKILHIKTDADSQKMSTQPSTPQATSMKRKRPVRDGDETESDDSDRDIVFRSRSSHKRRHRGPEPFMSGGLASSSPSQDAQQPLQSTPSVTITSPDVPSTPTTATNATNTNSNPTTSSSTSLDAASPPAAKLRMTVSRGFYVRSLCHDLGRAVGSLGIMCELVRTRQGPFVLQSDNHPSTEITNDTLDAKAEEVKHEGGDDDGDDDRASISGDPPTNSSGPDEVKGASTNNVFEYSDLAKGEEVWAPKVEKLLRLWNMEYANRSPDVLADGVDEGAATSAKTKEEDVGQE